MIRIRSRALAGGSVAGGAETQNRALAIRGTLSCVGASVHGAETAAPAPRLDAGVRRVPWQKRSGQRQKRFLFRHSLILIPELVWAVVGKTEY